MLVNTFLEGLLEALMFRGVLLQTLRKTVSIWHAVALATLAFVSVRRMYVFITGDPQDAVIQSTAAASSGRFFIAMRLRTGSLRPCFLVHGLWDCSAFLVAMSRPKDTSASTAPADGTSLAPILLVLPNAPHFLWMMRHRCNASASSENP